MLTTYQRTDMVYTDYQWQALPGDVIPEVIDGTHHSRLNRNEGYEMLHFISSLAKTWHLDAYPVALYRKLETIIRTKLPENVRTRAAIRDWIMMQYHV